MEYHLEFSYDSTSDVLTVEGVKWSGELFRAMAGTSKTLGLALNTPFKIVRRDDEHLYIDTIQP